MEITTEKTDSIIVVGLAADSLDASNTNEFKSAAAQAIVEKAKMVRDLAQVQFIDSSGIGAILSLLRKVSETGGDLKLSGLNQQPRTVFELSRLHHILDTYAAREAAAKAYQKG